jgi:hypothetical protein
MDYAKAIGPFETEAILVEQIWNRAKMGQLWKIRNTLDAGVASMIDCLYKTRNKGTVKGSSRVKYNLIGMAGKLGFGRLYGCKGSLEMIQADVRGTLCGEFYYDVDIANCHPELMHQIAKIKFNLDMPECRKFCENRDAYYAMLSDNRDVAKTEMFKVLYGGIPAIDELKPFKIECDNLSRLFATEKAYLSLLQVCKVRNPENIMGSFMSLVIQTEERRCLMALYKYFKLQDWSVDVLAYDGLMLRKQQDKELKSDHLNEASLFVKQETGYAVKLTTKEFSSISADELSQQDETRVEIADGVSNEVYLEAKKLFEETYFWYKPTNQIGEIQDEGELVFYEMDHAKEICKTEFSVKNKDGKKVCLFDAWRNDNEKRIVTKIQFEPSDDKLVLVLPMSFKYLQNIDSLETVSHELKQKIIDTFKNLTSVNTSHIDIETEYLYKYIADILQKPLIRPNVACLFIGEQGAYKDYLWEFIGTHILGGTYYTDYDKNTQFFDKYDTGKENKFLIKLQEADPEFCKKHSSDLKATITSPRLKFNPKGQKCYERNNYGRFILTTNKSNPLELEQSDRRWLIFRNSNELCKDRKRGDEIRSILEHKLAGVIVAEWLMSFDLSNFDANRDKPESEFKKIILDVVMSAEDRFIEQWDGVEIKASEFYDIYKDFCFQETLNYADNGTAFGRKLLDPICKGKIVKKRKSDGFYYKKP